MKAMKKKIKILSKHVLPASLEVYSLQLPDGRKVDYIDCLNAIGGSIFHSANFEGTNRVLESEKDGMEIIEDIYKFLDEEAAKLVHNTLDKLEMENGTILISVKEPLLVNKKGNVMSVNEFERSSYLLRSDSLLENGDRKHVILFGCDENGNWKYKIKVYAKGGKKYAFQAAFNCLKAYLTGHFDPNFRFEFGQAYVADFDPNWNKGVPLSF